MLFVVGQLSTLNVMVVSITRKFLKEIQIDFGSFVGMGN